MRNSFLFVFIFSQAHAQDIAIPPLGDPTCIRLPGGPECEPWPRDGILCSGSGNVSLFLGGSPLPIRIQTAVITVPDSTPFEATLFVKEQPFALVTLKRENDGKWHATPRRGVELAFAPEGTSGVLFLNGRPLATRCDEIRYGE